MIGSQDIIIALVLGLIFFGSKKLPELARGLGESLKEFKKVTNEPDPPAAAPPPTARPATPESRPCGQCQQPLQADWTHCPRCGASTAPEVVAQGRPTQS